jgi:hypothetical protein
VLDLVERNHGNAIRERSEDGQVRLRDNVGSRSENLRELHEIRAELNQSFYESGSTSLVKRFTAVERCSKEDPARKVATKRDGKREEPPDNYEGAKMRHEKRIKTSVLYDTKYTRGFVPHSPGRTLH